MGRPEKPESNFAPFLQSGFGVLLVPGQILGATQTLAKPHRILCQAECVAWTTSRNQVFNPQGTKHKENWVLSWLRSYRSGNLKPSAGT